MAPRLLALLTAVAMVVGSLALRARLDDGGGGGGSGGEGGGARLVCSTELKAACEALAKEAGADLGDVVVEPAGVTFDRLVSGTGDPGLDGWLVPAPWPQLVDERRKTAGNEPLFAPPAKPLARSPVVIVVWPERAEKLRQACGGQLGWRCLGDNAPKQWAAIGGEPAWGPVKPAHADPSSEAAGLTVIGAAASAFFGRTDFGRFDLDEAEFRGWFTGFERSAKRPSAPLDSMLRTNRAQIDAVGAIEAEAGPAVDRAANKPSVLYPEPVVTADVVLGVRPGKGGERITKLLQGRTGPALAGAGWRVDGEKTVAGIRAAELPPGSGLPPAGVLQALLDVHQEVAG